MKSSLMRLKLIVAYLLSNIFGSIYSDDAFKKPMLGQHLRIIPVEVSFFLTVNFCSV